MFYASFQLVPALSSYSVLPCQMKERWYFLPMKMMICCHQIISQSSFWHEKQVKVVWSHTVRKYLFSVSNHFSASFLSHLQFSNHLLRTSQSHWDWLHHGCIQGGNHLLVPSQACVSENCLSPVGQSVALGWLQHNLPAGIMAEHHGCCLWVHPRASTHLTMLQLLILGRASL